MRQQAVPKFLLLAALIAFDSLSQAQSTEAALKSRLKDKQLYLRGCWGGASLNFDSAGKLISPASTTSFTLSGFELKSLQLKNGKLILKGKRMGIEFSDAAGKDKQRLVPIHIDDPKIEIAAPASGDYSVALDAIFVNDIALLGPSIPVYWETWGRKNISSAYAGRTVAISDDPQPDEEDRPAADTTKPQQVGGSVHAPELLQHPEAEFDQAARKLKYSGKCIIKLIIGADGRPQHIRIDRPVGLGLDEQAVDSVAQYLFKPATREGKPVAVEVAIEVSFQIY